MVLRFFRTVSFEFSDMQEIDLFPKCCGKSAFLQCGNQKNWRQENLGPTYIGGNIAQGLVQMGTLLSINKNPMRKNGPPLFAHREVRKKGRIIFTLTLAEKLCKSLSPSPFT